MRAGAVSSQPAFRRRPARARRCDARMRGFQRGASRLRVLLSSPCAPTPPDARMCVADLEGWRMGHAARDGVCPRQGPTCFGTAPSSSFRPSSTPFPLPSPPLPMMVPPGAAREERGTKRPIGGEGRAGTQPRRAASRFPGRARPALSSPRSSAPLVDAYAGRRGCVFGSRLAVGRRSVDAHVRGGWAWASPRRSVPKERARAHARRARRPWLHACQRVYAPQAFVHSHSASRDMGARILGGRGEAWGREWGRACRSRTSAVARCHGLEILRTVPILRHRAPARRRMQPSPRAPRPRLVPTAAPPTRGRARVYASTPASIRLRSASRRMRGYRWTRSARAREQGNGKRRAYRRVDAAHDPEAPPSPAARAGTAPAGRGPGVTLSLRQVLGAIGARRVCVLLHPHRPSSGGAPEADVLTYKNSVVTALLSRRCRL
ncbi:hypothetical protein DFH07DRAFT_783539 [Mycena maculata]|uniref:Uncharacterized protein n=1 Tax=Mycena maculata TaxID=230809 RepID=A0AAD7HMP2_9AGAR|nr:hypothetical protein DFH07DRAFT_783539 [Mycena maculata]